MRGRPVKMYVVDGKKMTEREGVQMIKKNMKSRGIRYSDFLSRAKKQGQLSAYHSIYK